MIQFFLSFARFLVNFLNSSLIFPGFPVLVQTLNTSWWDFVDFIIATRRFQWKQKLCFYSRMILGTCTKNPLAQTQLFLDEKFWAIFRTKQEVSYVLNICSFQSYAESYKLMQFAIHDAFTSFKPKSTRKTSEHFPILNTNNYI